MRIVYYMQWIYIANKAATKGEPLKIEQTLNVPVCISSKEHK